MNAFTRLATGLTVLGIVSSAYGVSTYMRFGDVSGYLWAGIGLTIAGIALLGYERYDRVKQGRRRAGPHNKGLRPPGRGGA